jgi:hypothetical protein
VRAAGNEARHERISKVDRLEHRVSHQVPLIPREPRIEPLKGNLASHH